MSVFCEIKATKSPALNATFVSDIHLSREKSKLLLWTMSGKRVTDISAPLSPRRSSAAPEADEILFSTSPLGCRFQWYLESKCSK